MPGVILDGAHNPGAIEAFAESVNTQRGNNFEKIILFSAVKEKEYETMIHMLCESVDAKQYILTQIQNERGVSTKELADVFQKYTDKKIIEEENLEKAFYMALEEKGSMAGCIAWFIVSDRDAQRIDSRRKKACLILKKN